MEVKKEKVLEVFKIFWSCVEDEEERLKKREDVYVNEMNGVGDMNEGLVFDVEDINEMDLDDVEEGRVRGEGFFLVKGSLNKVGDVEEVEKFVFVFFYVIVVKVKVVIGM